MAVNAVTGLGMQVLIYKTPTEIVRVTNITSFPDIGSTPTTKDTTNKDNQIYESKIAGLQPLPVLEFALIAPPKNKDGSDLLSQLDDLDRNATYDIELTNPLGRSKRSGRAQVSVRNNSNNNDDVQMATLSLTCSALNKSTYFEAFQIFYDANGGKGPVPVDEGWYEASDVVTILDGKGLYYSSKQFEEWSTTPDGTGTTYQPGATLSLTENMTLYAQYGA